MLSGLYVDRTDAVSEDVSTKRENYMQSNTLESNVLGNSFLLRVIRCFTYSSTTDKLNFAKRTST